VTAVSRRKLLVIFAIVTGVLAAFVSQFASTSPDGLERVAAKLGFAGRGNTVIYAPAPDYSTPGVANGWLSGAVAGVVGAGLVFLCAYLAGRALSAERERRTRRNARTRSS
jgi:cobalt/nickel transport protein